MPAHSRSKNGVASLAYVAGICLSGMAGTSPSRDAQSSDQPERVHVGLEHRLVLDPLVLVLLAQTYHRAHGLHVVAVALGLGVDVADVVGDRLLLLLEP